MRLFANKEKEEAKAGKGIIRQDVQMDLSNKIREIEPEYFGNELYCR